MARPVERSVRQNYCAHPGPLDASFVHGRFRVARQLAGELEDVEPWALAARNAGDFASDPVEHFDTSFLVMAPAVCSVHGVAVLSRGNSDRLHIGAIVGVGRTEKLFHGTRLGGRVNKLNRLLIALFVQRAEAVVQRAGFPHRHRCAELNELTAVRGLATEHRDGVVITGLDHACESG